MSEVSEVISQPMAITHEAVPPVVPEPQSDLKWRGRAVFVALAELANRCILLVRTCVIILSFTGSFSGRGRNYDYPDYPDYGGGSGNRYTDDKGLDRGFGAKSWYSWHEIFRLWPGLVPYVAVFILLSDNKSHEDLEGFLFFYGMYSVCLFLVSFMLLIAASKEPTYSTSRMVTTWLLTNFLLFCVELVLDFYVVIRAVSESAYAKQGGPEYATLLVIEIFTSVLALAYGGTCLYVVYSFSNELDQHPLIITPSSVVRPQPYQAWAPSPQQNPFEMGNYVYPNQYQQQFGMMSPIVIIQVPQQQPKSHVDLLLDLIDELSSDSDTESVISAPKEEKKKKKKSKAVGKGKSKSVVKKEETKKDTKKEKGPRKTKTDP